MRNNISVNTLKWEKRIKNMLDNFLKLQNADGSFRVNLKMIFLL